MSYLWEVKALASRWKGDPKPKLALKLNPRLPELIELPNQTLTLIVSGKEAAGSSKEKSSSKEKFTDEEVLFDPRILGACPAYPRVSCLTLSLTCKPHGVRLISGDLHQPQLLLLPHKSQDLCVEVDRRGARPKSDQTGGLLTKVLVHLTNPNSELI